MGFSIHFFPFTWRTWGLVTNAQNPVCPHKKTNVLLLGPIALGWIR